MAGEVYDSANESVEDSVYDDSLHPESPNASNQRLQDFPDHVSETVMEYPITKNGENSLRQHSVSAHVQEIVPQAIENFPEQVKKGHQGPV